MPEEDFSRICAEEWERVPAPYKERIKNVALLVEDEPSDEVRRLEGLGEGETLLGLYQGIPQNVRGEGYGIGVTLPDTITIYRLPTLLEAEDLQRDAPERDIDDLVREVVRDTIWHEVGHYFGHDEDAIQGREQGGTSGFGR
jgi:predicted Zn-dependent protease with MMP-like domain